MQNRQSTINDYHERINKVLVYINNHLDEKLELNKLAGISNFSVHHFHRIMSAHLNEALGSYIIRLRMDTSVKLLKYTEESITDIAFRVGYDVPTSFNKAFKSHFGISPLEFKSHQKDYNILDKFSNNFKNLILMELKPVIKMLKPKQVIFIRVTGKYGDENMGKGMSQLIEHMKKHKLFSWKTELIGISHDNPEITEVDKCRYDACIAIRKPAQPEGEIGCKEISGGQYAIFRFKGPYKNFGIIYNEIYRNWLPASGYKLRDIPCFEKYLNNPGNTKPEKLLTEIYIPIE